MITRKEYMSENKLTNGQYDGWKGQAAHNRYFAQFVNQWLIDTVVSRIGESVLLRSRDYHLNDIPLDTWDRLPMTNGIADKAKELGDNTSLGTKVCVYKAAARSWLADHGTAKIWPVSYKSHDAPSDVKWTTRAFAIGETMDEALALYQKSTPWGHNFCIYNPDHFNPLP